MRGMTKLLSFFVLVWISLDARANSGLIGRSYIHVSIGNHTHDEFTFEKGKPWTLSFINRGLSSGEFIRKRRVPKKLVLPLITELDRFMRLNQHDLAFRPGEACTTQMKVEWGSSATNSTGKIYCVDRLSRTSNQELAEWMRSFKRLFRY